MAKCAFCNQEMLDRNIESCLANTEVEFPDGKILVSIPYNPADSFKGRRCSDCNIKAGGFHHTGCDMERCPRCKGQLISCGCLDPENE